MRPRKSNRHLPRRMVESHGAFYLLQPVWPRRNKWISLGKDYAGALKRYAAVISEADEPGSGMTKLVDSWLAERRMAYAAKTWAEYERMALKIKKAFQNFNVEQVRPKHAAEFLDTNFNTKPNTANKYRALLSLMMQFAVRKGLIDINPVREIAGYPEAKRDRYITDDELLRIKAACTGRTAEMTRCLIDLAYITAQRFGDLLRLRWSDVTEEGIYFYPSKTVNSSGVRLLIERTADLTAVLERAKAGKVKGMTVIHAMDGSQYTYSGAQSAWRRACEAAGIEDAHFHDLRAKALTDAKRQGLDAQGLGGHTTEAMTAHYVKARNVQRVTPLQLKKG